MFRFRLWLRSGAAVGAALLQAPHLRVAAAGDQQSSMRAALTNGLIAVGLAWGIDMAIAIAVLAIQPAGSIGDFEFSVAAMITLGPLAGYMVELDPLPILVAVALTLLGREIVIRRLWAVTIHGAERL